MRANIPVEGLSAENLLEDWTWLAKKRYTLIAMNAFGDMFLRGESGETDMLQLEAGEVTTVADSATEFQKLTSDKEKQQSWFFTGLLTRLEMAGHKLDDGQCFALKKPIVLGGSVSLDNIEVAPITVHVSLLGQIHRQVQQLAPGTKVQSIKVE